MIRLLTRWSPCAKAICPVAIVIALLGCARLPFFGSSQPAPTASPQVVPSGYFKPTDAQWGSLKFAAVREMTFTPSEQTEGKIAAIDDLTTAVFSPYSGRVTRVFVRAGDVVRRGAPLVALQASEYVQAQNDLAAAATALNTARAQQRLAQSTAARQEKLYRINAAALKDVEQSRLDLRTAQETVHADEVALAAVRSRLRILGKNDAEIDALERAGVRRAMPAEAVVAAPVGGTVLQRQVGVGQNVESISNGGSSSLFVIGDLSKVWLIANVREAGVGRVQLGDPALVHVLAFPEKTFEARVSYVAPSLDPATHRLPVRATLDNPGGFLRPEMFANFRILTGTGANAVGVPEEAIVYEGDAARVYVVGPNRTLGMREIRTGATSGGVVQVRNGLRPGEQVVTSGSVFIDRAAQGVQGD